MHLKPFIFLSIILIGCPFQSDYVRDLNSGYRFISEAKTYRTISKSVRRNGKVEVVEIPRSILAYSYDDQFIIASQVPIEERDNLTEEEKQMDLSAKLNYWIIDGHKDLLYGPLDVSEYERMREKLGVPETLNLGRNLK
jgi:hypothetical protein